MPRLLGHIQVTVSMVEHFKGMLGQGKKSIRDNVSGRMLEVTAQAMSREEYLAILFLLGADPRGYGKAMNEVKNAHLQGQDTYLMMVVLAYQMILHQEDGNKHVGATFEQQNRVTFATIGNGVSTEEWNVLANAGSMALGRRSPCNRDSIKCFNCLKLGHFESECPEAVTMMMVVGV